MAQYAGNQTRSNKDKQYQKFSIGNGRTVINLFGSAVSIGEEIINTWNERGSKCQVVPNNGNGKSKFILATTEGTAIGYINSQYETINDVQADIMRCRDWHEVKSVDLSTI